MISANAISLKGTLGEKVKLSDRTFSVPTDETLTATAVRVYMSNQRKSSAKTKTRSEVRKTTAKMYRQKGTGRARHGAYSAPIFVGGGVAHGPDGTQNYKLSLSKKLTKKALLSVLSEKANEKNIFVIQEEKGFTGKSKEAVLLVNKVTKPGERLMVVSGIKQSLVRRAFRNISNVDVVTANQLNVYSVVLCDQLLFTAEGLKETTTLMES